MLLVDSKPQPQVDSLEDHRHNPIILEHRIILKEEAYSGAIRSLRIKCLANSKLSQMVVFLAILKASSKHLDSSMQILNNHKEQEECLANRNNRLVASLVEAIKIKEGLVDSLEDSNSNSNSKMLVDYSELGNSKTMVLWEHNKHKELAFLANLKMVEVLACSAPPKQLKQEEQISSEILQQLQALANNNSSNKVVILVLVKQLQLHKVLEVSLTVYSELMLSNNSKVLFSILLQPTLQPKLQALVKLIPLSLISLETT